MSHPDCATLRFHQFGEPGEVLQLDRAPVPQPGPGQVLVRVHACGLNPADWALCRGLFPGSFPRGIGLEISGTVEAVGDAVTDVVPGDEVLGAADYAGCHLAGASEFTLVNHWAPLPAGLGLVEAAALPMAVETAFRSVEMLGVTGREIVLIHGAGTTVGFAAVQICLERGSRVLATAGPTYADRLRALGAKVTEYGEGMVERVRALGIPDLVLDTAPPSGAIPALVKIVDGEAKRILTITDFVSGRQLGCLDVFGGQDVEKVFSGEGDFDPSSLLRYDVLGKYAQMAAQGKFSIPIARTFPLSEWRVAMELSLGGHARGKVVLLIEKAT